MNRFLQLALDLFDPPARPAADTGTRPQPPTDASGPRIAGSGADDPTRRPVTTPAATLDQVLAPARFTHARANRQALLGATHVAYEFRRARRRNIGFSVGPEGLTVSAPKWVPLYEVESALQSKSAWILRKLDEMRDRAERLETARIDWKEGATFPFLGETVIVVLDPRQGSAGGGQLQSDSQSLPGVARHTLHLGLSHAATPAQIRDAVQAWLMRQATRVFTERLHHFAPQLGVQWKKLSLSSASTRWGTASADGSIRLNWRLIHFRLAVVDYVVAHELSHLRVMDHSPRFWDTVATVVPDYQVLRGQLRDEALPHW
jgi:predicted metal-dependent hydrolase